MSTTSLKRKKSQRLLYGLGGFLTKRFKIVLFSFLLVTLFFGYFASKLEQKTSVRDLLPAGNQAVQRFEDTVRDFDLIDRVVVVLQFDPEHLESAQAFAEILVDQVREQKEFESLLSWFVANLYHETDDSNWYEFLQYLPRLLPPEHLQALADRLTADGIAERVAQNRRELESGLTSKNLIRNDPLNLLEFAGTYSRDVAGNYRISFIDGFPVSKDRSMLLILGKPIVSPENVEFSTELETFLQRCIEESKTIFEEEEGQTVDGLLEVGLTGPHPITAHENRTIKSDVVNMFASSLALVLLLFVLAYGRPLAIFYVGIPLLLAQVWTLGIGYLLFGRLNLLTATFSAVIVGLGVDYAIHLFSRYLDERQHGHGPNHALIIALGQTGLGTLIGGVTTALAFAAMGFTRFSGLREFAVIAAIGIIVCLVQMFIMLPCMILWRERWRKHEKILRPQSSFQLEHLVKFSLNNPRLLLALLGTATIFLGFQAVQLRFTTDIRSVRARSNPSITLQNLVTSKVGGSLRSLTFVLTAPTEAQLYELHDRISPTLLKLKEEGSLVRWDSLLSILQKPHAQQENMGFLRSKGLSGDLVKQQFLEAQDRHAFRIDENTQAYIENLANGLNAIDALGLKNLVDQNPALMRPFLHYDNGQFKTLLNVYPSQGLWDKKATKSVTQAITSISAEVPGSELFVTGIQTISDELKTLMKDSFRGTTAISLAFVLLLLWIHFRKISLVLLTLTPLLTAVIWMLGTMRLIGIDITILNFVATPLIIGIGIDDGVHIVEKYLYRKQEDITALIVQCGKAVTLTSLTTITGFSSLFLADYSGFRSLGLCAILGVAFCWLGSVILLPLLMQATNVKFTREAHKVEQTMNPKPE